MEARATGFEAEREASEKDQARRYGVAAVPTGRPTLSTASKNNRGRPHSELKKSAVTLTAIATMAQTG
jgi:hypothetical protein